MGQPCKVEEEVAVRIFISSIPFDAAHVKERKELAMVQPKKMMARVYISGALAG